MSLFDISKLTNLDYIFIQTKLFKIKICLELGFIFRMLNLRFLKSLISVKYVNSVSGLDIHSKGQLVYCRLVYCIHGCDYC